MDGAKYRAIVEENGENIYLSLFEFKFATVQNGKKSKGVNTHARHYKYIYIIWIHDRYSVSVQHESLTQVKLRRYCEKEGYNCNSFPLWAPGVPWVRLIPKASKRGNGEMQSYVCRGRERDGGAGELEWSRKPFNILGHGLRWETALIPSGSWA